MKTFNVKTYGDFNHSTYVPFKPTLAIGQFILWAFVIISDYEKFGYKVDVSAYKEDGIVINVVDVLGIYKGFKGTIIRFEEAK